MSKVRFLLVGAGATLALGTAGVLASVGAVTLTNSDSHGDAVASAARDTCPRGASGVHGECVSAIASSKSESKSESEAPDTTCTSSSANDATEDASEPKTPLRRAPTPPRLPTRRKASPRRPQPRRRTSRNEMRARRKRRPKHLKRRTDSQGGGGNMTWADVS